MIWVSAACLLAAAPPPGERSVAILPFHAQPERSANAERAEAYLRDAVQKLPDVRLMSRDQTLLLLQEASAAGFQSRENN